MLTQHIREFLQVKRGPFLDFLGGAWGRGYCQPMKEVGVSAVFGKATFLHTKKGSGVPIVTGVGYVIL